MNTTLYLLSDMLASYSSGSLRNQLSPDRGEERKTNRLDTVTILFVGTSLIARILTINSDFL